MLYIDPVKEGKETVNVESTIIEKYSEPEFHIIINDIEKVKNGKKKLAKLYKTRVHKIVEAQ